jgi:hypothetical protein
MLMMNCAYCLLSPKARQRSNNAWARSGFAHANSTSTHVLLRQQFLNPKLFLSKLDNFSIVIPSDHHLLAVARIFS